jgi:hypothetical protein
MAIIIAGNFPAESEKPVFPEEGPLPLEFPSGLWKIEAPAAKPGVSATGL